MGLSFYKDGTGLFAELPHLPIDLSICHIVEDAICATWNLLRTNPRPGFDLLNAQENTITHELRERLLDEVFNKGVVPGFDKQLFTTIMRDPKVSSYDGSNINKMPDLIVSIYNRNVYKESQDGLFIECKPVDTAHSLCAHYCDKGVVRFVCGEYAWAMTNALMVGYVCNGYSITPNLVDALKDREKKIPTVIPPYPCQQSKLGKNNEVVHISQHSRTFDYIQNGQPAPEITLRHLWLRRD